MTLSKFLLTLLLSFLAYGCAAQVQEVEVQYIHLAAPLDKPKAQISSMTWCGDRLLLLPERPWFEIAEDDTNPSIPIESYIYQLDLKQIDDYLADSAAKPLRAKRIPLLENNVRSKLKTFDGYEAIVCSDNQIWLALETEVNAPEYETNIVAATLNELDDNSNITIDPTRLYRIESQSGIDNYSDETLLLDGNKLIAIHEANSTARNTPSFATRINTQTDARDKIGFPAIAFRITDATELDADRYFWGINYAWSGELKWFLKPDKISKQYGLGETHKLEPSVERLVRFKMKDQEILRVDEAPIQLKLTQEDGRNWEGIVRYRDKGLLLITDEHPRTLFGYVDFNKLAPANRAYKPKQAKMTAY